MDKKFLYSPLSIKSIGENGVFSGYASVFNIVDKQNDLILPGAFKENLNRNKIKLLWQHNPGEPIRKEKKYSWSTVFAWLYLKMIGRILPKKWNKWAENILYYDKTTANNEVQTDAFKTIDRSVQVDLKPEGLEKSYKGLTEDAGKREEELTKYKQDKKAMQDKVDEQQKTIFDQYIIELKSRLKDKEDKLIELNQQWQASKLVALLKSQTDKLWQAKDKNTELENKVSDLGHENKALRLSVNTIDLESKLKDLSSQLSAAEVEKKSSENEVSKLQKQVRNLPNKLSRDKDLNNFLSGKNKELKKGFPEFKEKHFCYNVLNETIKSLSNQDDGKFESSKLLELLESNLKQSAREIIEAKVKEVVNKHYNIGKNVGKELQDGTLKAKLSPSVRNCIKELELNKRKEGVNKIVSSILHSFDSENNNNNDSVELLKEIVVKELVEARMRFFLDKIQELQLTSSIRDKFLSTDQGMCNQTQGGVNEYQLTEKAKKEYTPNSLMSYTNTVVHSLNAQRVA
ncbi:hypothetical protein EUZ93_01680 [Wolbachia pipientis]|nr:hypothetical protein [Wolbachia pipientis]